MGIQQRVQGQRESMAWPGTVRSLERCSSAVTFLLFQAVKREGTPSHCWGGYSTTDLLIIFIQTMCISLGAWEQI